MSYPQYDDPMRSAQASLERERAEWERQRHQEMQAIMEMKRALTDSWLALETEQRTLRSRHVVGSQVQAIEEETDTTNSNSSSLSFVEAETSEAEVYQAPSNSVQLREYEECVLDATTIRRRNPTELFQLLREDTWRRQT